MEIKHLVSSAVFDRHGLTALLLAANRIAELVKARSPALRDRMAGRQMCTLFYEPSTRTRLSFESAAHLMGMSVVSTENAALFSSAIKGETLEDTIRVLGGYRFDALVMRHSVTGAAERAAEVCERHGLPMHIISAGDGTGEHPTQSLLDLYTIWKERAECDIDGLTVAIGGDLKHGRTVRSLAFMLSLFKTRIIFVAPEPFAIQDDVKTMLLARGIEFREERDPAKALPEADAIYWVRLQRERIENPKQREMDLSQYNITGETVKTLKPGAIIMHPLPRVHEIAPEVDAYPGAAYFRQAWNGLPVRMALLQKICLGEYGAL